MSEEPETPMWVLVVTLFITVSFVGSAWSCVARQHTACKAQGKVLLRGVLGYECVSK